MGVERVLRLGRVWMVVAVLVWSGAARAALLPVSEAKALLEKKAFDEIYLAWSSVKPGKHPDGDAQVAAVLLEAARQALAAQDPSLALGLSDKARALDPKSVAACLVNFDAALALEQRGAAEAALDRAFELAPRNWDVVFRRADYAEQEGQLEKAVELYRRIPKSHPKHAGAQTKAALVEKVVLDDRANLAELRRAEDEQKRAQIRAGETVGSSHFVPPASGEPEEVAPPVPSPASQSATPAGMAARTSRNFRILYQGGAKDFGQRAQYEQRVLDMFEKAHASVLSLLGRATSQATDVVLYTEEEFRFHFGSMFGGGVLGFYSGKIRMNRAERLDDAFYATAVHEYVHAAVDAIATGSGDDVPVWMNEGLARWTERRIAGGDFIDRGELYELQSLKASGQLPPIAALDRGFGEMGPLTGVAYAKSSAAIEALANGGGLSKIVRVIELVGRGQPFAKVFAEQFGSGRLARLDADVDALIDR